MPRLKNSGWEAFVHARARGLDLTNAWREAGHRRNRAASGRIDKLPQVKNRLAELRLQHEALRKAHMEETIAALVDMADGADLKTGVGIKEARAARLEAHRLSALHAQQDAAENWDPPRPLTTAEWLAEYGPDARTPTD